MTEVISFTLVRYDTIVFELKIHLFSLSSLEIRSKLVGPPRGPSATEIQVAFRFFNEIPKIGGLFLLYS